MSDAPNYDPDRMRLEDIDPSDHETLLAYLDHPNTKALHVDLGRQFRSLPALDQIVQLERDIEKWERKRDLWAVEVTRMDSAEMKAALEEMRVAVEDDIIAARARIHELSDGLA